MSFGEINIQDFELIKKIGSNNLNSNFYSIENIFEHLTNIYNIDKLFQSAFLIYPKNFETNQLKCIDLEYLTESTISFKSESNSQTNLNLSSYNSFCKIENSIYCFASDKNIYLLDLMKNECTTLANKMTLNSIYGSVCRNSIIYMFLSGQNSNSLAFNLTTGRFNYISPIPFLNNSSVPSGNRRMQNTQNYGYFMPNQFDNEIYSDYNQSNYSTLGNTAFKGLEELISNKNKKFKHEPIQIKFKGTASILLNEIVLTGVGIDGLYNYNSQKNAYEKILILQGSYYKYSMNNWILSSEKECMQI